MKINLNNAVELTGDELYTMTLYGRYMWVRMISDGNTRDKGFFMSWTSEPKCKYGIVFLFSCTDYGIFTLQ